MKRRRTTTIVALVLVAGTTLATPAQAVEEVEAAFRLAYEAGTELYTEGRYAEALIRFDEAYALRPAREVVFARARCLHRMERFEDAAASYEKFLETAPAEEAGAKARVHLSEALLHIAHARLAAGEPATARTAIARAIEAYRSKDPALHDETSGDLLTTLGDAHAALGERDEAISAYERALLAVTADDLRARLESGLAVLRATPAATATPSVTDPPAPAAKPASGRWALPVTTGVATLAATAAGATLLILSQRNPVEDQGQEAYFSSFEARRRELRAGWGLVIAGGALGLTTIIATTVTALGSGTRSGGEPSVAPTVGIGPGAVSLSWRF